MKTFKMQNMTKTCRAARILYQIRMGQLSSPKGPAMDLLSCHLQTVVNKEGGATQW